MKNPGEIINHNIVIQIITAENANEKLSTFIILLKYDTFVFQSQTVVTKAAAKPKKTTGNSAFLNLNISENKPKTPIPAKTKSVFKILFLFQ